MDFDADSFQEPFTTKDFIERLTQDDIVKARTRGFNEQPFIEVIKKSIGHLIQLDAVVQRKLESLEDDVKGYERVEHREILNLLNQQMQITNVNFEKIDRRVKLVSSKTAVVGDQLNTLNTRRMRAAEARSIMTHFKAFDCPQGQTPQLGELFSNPDKVHEATGILHKLNALASELTEDRYRLTKQRIINKCNEVEQTLLHQFSQAYNLGDMETMKKCATTLSQSKGFSQCMDLYINQHPFFYLVDKQNMGKTDLFAEVVEVCKNESHVIREVFETPGVVMHRFLERIYEQKLQTHVDDKLDAAKQKSLPAYLAQLTKLHARSIALNTELCTLPMCNEPTLLTKLTESLFCLHLPDDVYIRNEIRSIRVSYIEQLNTYYNSLGHMKSTNQTSTNLMGRMFDSLTISKDVDENRRVPVSSELALTFIYENKEALVRAKQLSPPEQVAENIERIVDLLLKFLCVQHLDYALDLAITQLMISGPMKQAPSFDVFETVSKVNYVFHVLQTYFNTSVLPAVDGYFTIQSSITDQKDGIAQTLQTKMNSCLVRSLEVYITWVNTLWKTHQNIADFSPDDDDMSVFQSPRTKACNEVCNFIATSQQYIKTSLDGNNAVQFIMQLTIEFEKALLQHIRQFQITNIGALLLSRDVDSYANAFKEFEVPETASVFQIAKDMGTIYMVSPDNIKQIATETSLSRLNRDVLIDFLECRSDWKESRSSLLGNLNVR
eukprot:CFRG8580T1